MSIFTRNKKEQLPVINSELKPSQAAAAASKPSELTSNPSAEATSEPSVLVLGSGCSKCMQLEKNAAAALIQLGIEAVPQHVTDFAQIASYGVMQTPALVVDGTVVSCGKVLKPEEISSILIQHRREI